jgi:hypothetical protein
MFLTKLKPGTAAVLCACLIGGSFTSLGIAQDAKPKHSTSKLADADQAPKIEPRKDAIPGKASKVPPLLGVVEDATGRPLPKATVFIRTAAPRKGVGVL